VEGSAAFAESPLLAPPIQVATLPKSNHPPLCHPVGAPKERSGGTCGSAALSWKCFLAKELWTLRPPQGDEKRFLSSNLLFSGSTPSPLSSRPKRTRISYFALLATSTCAALRRESRMQIIKATGLDRKSGGAQWRDLYVDALSWKCFSCRACYKMR
jgi:hypothetical protein